MFKVFMDGNDGKLRLENERGQRVGWIWGQAIGFSGLPTANAARLAAVRAWPALETTLLRDYPGRVGRPINKSNVRVVYDGAYEWVADGNRPLARLLPPNTHRNSEDSFALEFLVPSYATHHVTIAAAHAMWEALAEHITPVEDAGEEEAAMADRTFQLISTTGVERV